MGMGEGHGGGANAASSFLSSGHQLRGFRKPLLERPAKQRKGLLAQTGWVGAEGALQAQVLGTQTAPREAGKGKRAEEEGWGPTVAPVLSLGDKIPHK